MANSPVTELVQNLLRVPFPEFMKVFAERMEPVLLAQPGMLSVTTGVVVASNNGHEPCAISIAQWDSLEAHEAFLRSTAATPFFEAAKTITNGPPIIQHYLLGEISFTSFKKHYSRIFKSSSSNTGQLPSICERHVEVYGKSSANIGSCIESQAQSALLLFGDELDFGWHDDCAFDVEWFTVQWNRHGTNAVGPNL